MRLSILASFVLLLVPACARTETLRPAPPVAVTSAPVPAAPRGLYRLDFVLTTKDGGTTSSPETFSYVVEDQTWAEIHSGANVPLWVDRTSAPAVAPGAPGAGTPFGAPRQDTGLRVKSNLRKQLGGDVVLDLEVELSSADAPTEGRAGPVSIRKFRSTGKALLVPGKSATVVTLDEVRKHYDLAVTATQLR